MAASGGGEHGYPQKFISRNWQSGSILQRTLTRGPLAASMGQKRMVLKTALQSHAEARLQGRRAKLNQIEGAKL